MFIKLGFANDVGSATSIPFVLPAGTSRVKFLRAGGADAGSGLYIKDAFDNVLCAAETGTDTNSFFTDYCDGLDSFGADTVHLYLADTQSSGWGKVYIDDINFVDASGVALSISQATTPVPATPALTTQQEERRRKWRRAGAVNCFSASDPYPWRSPDVSGRAWSLHFVASAQPGRGADILVGNGREIFLRSTRCEDQGCGRIRRRSNAFRGPWGGHNWPGMTAEVSCPRVKGGARWG